jgi:phage baseplate assembly protein W
MSFDLKIKNGDISVGNSGVVNPVIGNAKLKQDILKILLTDVGSNKFHSKYGSFLGKLKIGSTADEQIITLDLEKSARNAINNLMKLQRFQASKQSLSSGEVIVEVLNVFVERSKDDPRAYNIIVSVLTGELTELTTSMAVRIA